MVALLVPEKTNSVENDLTCDLCLKVHQRRDLFMRHRRRCNGPRKSLNRRKACNACAQAKAKCCYTQPTCVRCVKRGTECVYTGSIPDQREQLDGLADFSYPRLDSSSTGMGEFSTPTEPFTLELPAWDFSTSPGPHGPFDINLADLVSPAVTLPGSTIRQSPMVQGSWDFTPPSQMLSLSPVSRDIPASAPPSDDKTSSAALHSSSSTPLALVRILSDYPSLLMKGSFSSPFLHTSLSLLYSKVAPDMSLLPQTSMAICCGSGIKSADSTRFIRRAMDAARQRLIGSFPSSQCMEQWDALHAMLIYEALDLSVIDETDVWKHSTPVKGLGSPFLLKMTQTYLQHYPEIRNPDTNVFSDPRSIPCSAATSTWARWRITETARRTIFFANVVNFYSNRDHNTGKQMPYYEPLDDELILNMPLPCSQAAWLARNEEDWKLAMSRLPSPASHLPSGFNGPEDGKFCSETLLKTVFSKFSKDYIHAKVGQTVGFGDSDELRNLIVLCASEQFI